jgi:arylsulfatase A
MKRRDFIRTAGLAAAAMLPAGCISPGVQRKARLPNVVLILADDLGWSELGCYGNSFNETPSLDRLARQGMRFTNAYAAAPVCSPYRAALMSGQYPARIGVTDYLRSNTDWHLPDDMVTLPELFRKAGYTTGMTGKWHLSGYNRDGVKSGPGKHGFDEVMISEQTGIGGGSYFHPYKRVNPKLGTVLGKREYLTDRLNHEAVQFINRNKDKPFFLYKSHYAVHTGLRGKEKLVDHFKSKPNSGTNKNNPVLAAMLKSIDEGVGMIMSTLEALDLTDNTIVIFTSDNGGESRVTGNAPLRAGKSCTYEGGLREPLIVSWPAVTKPGSLCHTPTMNIDFYPTFATLTGMHPPSHDIDGLSIVPLLEGKQIDGRPLYWHYPLSKPHFLGGKSSGAIRKGDWKLIERFDNQTLELYNLADDIGEKNNLVNQQPERVKQLHKRLAEWRKDVSAKLPAGQDYVEP